jgi:hypothetical protein
MPTSNADIKIWALRRGSSRINKKLSWYPVDRNGKVIDRKNKRPLSNHWTFAADEDGAITEPTSRKKNDLVIEIRSEQGDWVSHFVPGSDRGSGEDRIIGMSPSASIYLWMEKTGDQDEEQHKWKCIYSNRKQNGAEEPPSHLYDIEGEAGDLILTQEAPYSLDESDFYMENGLPVYFVQGARIYPAQSDNDWIMMGLKDSDELPDPNDESVESINLLGIYPDLHQSLPATNPERLTEVENALKELLAASENSDNAERFNHLMSRNVSSSSGLDFFKNAVNKFISIALPTPNLAVNGVAAIIPTVHGYVESLQKSESTLAEYTKRTGQLTLPQIILELPATVLQSIKNIYFYIKFKRKYKAKYNLSDEEYHSTLVSAKADLVTNVSKILLQVPTLIDSICKISSKTPIWSSLGPISGIPGAFLSLLFGLRDRDKGYRTKERYKVLNDIEKEITIGTKIKWSDNVPKQFQIIEAYLCYKLKYKYKRQRLSSVSSFISAGGAYLTPFIVAIGLTGWGAVAVGGVAGLVGIGAAAYLTWFQWTRRKKRKRTYREKAGDTAKLPTPKEMANKIVEFYMDDINGAKTNTGRSMKLDDQGNPYNPPQWDYWYKYPKIVEWTESILEKFGVSPDDLNNNTKESAKRTIRRHLKS